MKIPELNKEELEEFLGVVSRMVNSILKDQTLDDLNFLLKKHLGFFHTDISTSVYDIYDNAKKGGRESIIELLCNAKLVNGKEYLKFYTDYIEHYPDSIRTRR